MRPLALIFILIMPTWASAEICLGAGLCPPADPDWKKKIILDLTNGRCDESACLKEYIDSLPNWSGKTEYIDSLPKRSGRYGYYVSGYGDTGYASGEVKPYGDLKVEGYISLEDGSEVYFDGEFTGSGLIAGSDENGNYYQFNIDY